MNIKEILFIIALIMITIYMYNYINNNGVIEKFGTGGEIDQYLTSYFTRGYLVYPGTIVMWAGTISSIPKGYVLCDGSNGTPDLRDKFIIGAGNKYQVANYGGNDTIVLSVDQLPAHSHTGSGTTNGQDSGMKCHMDAGGRTDDAFALGIWENNSKNDRPCPSHTHTLNFTTNNTGSNKGIDIRPPYYALAFIMKSPN
jgi:hypothetical protein